MSATPLTAQQADAILAPFIVMGRSHSWLRFKTIEAWVHHDLAAGLLLMIERGLVASTYTLYRHGEQMFQLSDSPRAVTVIQLATAVAPYLPVSQAN